MIIRSLKLTRSANEPSGFPRSPFAEIAVSGRSNVGKSSLLNTLLGRRNFARISKKPGKTRSLNFYLVNDSFYLVDLPGYGYAGAPEETRRGWRMAIFDYVGNRRPLAGVVQLVDSRHPPSKDDRTMVAGLVGSGRPFVIALTKVDKIGRSGRGKAVGDLNAAFESLPAVFTSKEKAGEAGMISVPVIFFSSKTGEGRRKLWSWVESRIEGFRCGRFSDR